MANSLVTSKVKGFLSIGRALLGQSSSKREVVSTHYRYVSQAINTNRQSALVCSSWEPVDAPFLTLRRHQSSNSICKLKMVNSGETATAPAESTNGCDNGHGTPADGQHELLADSVSFKEVRIPLAWGELAGKSCSSFI